ncbi:MAG TPA: UPF0280 family protein [Thermoanaerobacterales bacterium]|nr:UPF0280 family protein [Thermoanaerobacterales bacterium]
MYQERFYRKFMRTQGLVQFNVTEGESDLQIFSECYLENEARMQLKKYRNEIFEYIEVHPEFLTSLVPLVPKNDAPKIVKHMCFAAETAGVGPMAAVAGALSQYVGTALAEYTDEIIIENGGDIYMKNKTDKHVLIYAGNSPLSNKIALLVPGENKPIGVCTSSGTVGHSLSFGKADAVVVISKDVLLADAAATAVCNGVKGIDDLELGLNFAKSIPGIEGIVVIIRDKLGAWGNVSLVNPSTMK